MSSIQTTIPLGSRKLVTRANVKVQSSHQKFADEIFLAKKQQMTAIIARTRRMIIPTHIYQPMSTQILIKSRHSRQQISSKQTSRQLRSSHASLNESWTLMAISQAIPFTDRDARLGHQDRGDRSVHKGGASSAGSPSLPRSSILILDLGRRGKP